MAVNNIFFYSSRKQNRFLKNESYFLRKLNRSIGSKITAIQQYFAFYRIIKPRNEGGCGGFTPASRSYKCICTAPFQFETYIMKYFLSIRVTERNMTENDVG